MAAPIKVAHSWEIEIHSLLLGLFCEFLLEMLKEVSVEVLSAQMGAEIIST